MNVSTAVRAPRGTHGGTFAERIALHDGTLVVAVGAVLGGADRVGTADVLRSGVRAIVTAAAAFPDALAALERVLERHAHARRDAALAAATALLALAPDGTLTFAGAGPLHCAILAAHGGGEPQRLHARRAALGALAAPGGGDELLVRRRLDTGDTVVAATVALTADAIHAAAGDARALLDATDAHDAAAALLVR